MNHLVQLSSWFLCVAYTHLKPQACVLILLLIVMPILKAPLHMYHKSDVHSGFAGGFYILNLKDCKQTESTVSVHWHSQVAHSK